MQTVKWYRLTAGGDDKMQTEGMNVPGGVVIRCRVWGDDPSMGPATLCFVPNVVLVEKDGEVGFESTVVEMMKLGALVGAQVMSDAMGDLGR